MNIRQLEAFHNTIETGSVTHAAERMRISQPAVSKLLRSFSDACGFQLFVRTNGRLTPTLEARMLATEVAKMFSGTARVARLADAVRNQEWGEITLVAPPALTTRFLAQSLAPLLADQPDIHFTMRSLPSPRIIDLVAAQQVDIGLSVLPFENPNVEAERLIRFEMVCVLPTGHPLADKAVVDLEDLSSDPFISLARDDCSLMTIDRAFQIKGVQKKNRIEVPLSETACCFVASGVGVSIVPSFVGLDFAPDMLIRRRIVPETTIDLWLLTPKNHPKSLAASKLIDFLRQVIAPFDVRQ
ncbi:LysR substrate-binding domain-containing protein [Brucella pseudogrignonensis]|jgi:DNA-binding transcriptional LysR family regulator|uniref:LysR substrate-binding domain-containing protein n=1 Tax=Brucella pseudogrignonensis TaxID=419475 RepID=UPI0038B670CA